MKMLSNLKYSLVAICFTAFLAVPTKSVASFLVEGDTDISPQVESVFGPTYNIGYTFTTGNTPLTVYALGSIDLTDADGVSQYYISEPPTSIGLWDSSGTLLASVSVDSTGTFLQSGVLPQNTFADADDTDAAGFRYTTLATPVVLSMNTTYTIGGNYGIYYVKLPSGTVTMGGGATYGQSVFDGRKGPDLVYPSITTTISAYSQLIGPNASFSPVPEPSNFAVLALVGAIAVYITSRRRKLVA